MAVIGGAVIGGSDWWQCVVAVIGGSDWWQ